MDLKIPATNPLALGKLQAVPYLPAGNEPKPEAPAPAADLTLVTSSESLQTQSLAAGSSVTSVPLVDTLTIPENASELELAGVTPQALDPKDLERILTTYNTLIQQGLQNAGPDSPLGRFANTLQLMANLQDSRLKEDPQAWEILQMRRSQIESAYQSQIQDPEVKAFFDKARSDSLGEVFGTQIIEKARQQAAWILSDEFQQSLFTLPAEQVSEKIQQALANLAVINPALAEQVAAELADKTVDRQALTSLQSKGSDGKDARAGFAEIMQAYLKTQQSTLKVGMAANNFSRLMTLSEERMDELTEAVAGLAAGSQAKSPQQLMDAMLGRVDELPVQLRPDATALITNLRTQNFLGALVLAGSVAGMMKIDVPQDPKAWLSMTSSALSTAGNAHYGLRFLGFSKAADVANLINQKIPVGSLKIPALGVVTGGLGVAIDAISLKEELANEDLVGSLSKGASLASGLASLAAITIISGPAAPVVLIGSTVVGLAAWGVNSIWGESDLTGMIRQQLRGSGIRGEEERLVQQIGDQQMAATVPERIALINGLMDQATDVYEETRITQQLIGSNDAEFVAQIQNLHLSRLVSELENPDELLAVLKRAHELLPDQAAKNELLNTALKTLQDHERFGEMNQLLNLLPAGSLNQLPPELVLGQLIELSTTSLQADSRLAIYEKILTHPDLGAQRQALLAQDSLIEQLRSVFLPAESAPMISRLLASAEPTQQALGQKLLSVPENKNEIFNAFVITPMGMKDAKGYGAEVSLQTLRYLNNDQIQQLSPAIRQQLLQSLENLYTFGADEEKELAKYRALLSQ